MLKKSTEQDRAIEQLQQEIEQNKIVYESKMESMTKDLMNKKRLVVIVLLDAALENCSMIK